MKQYPEALAKLEALNAAVQYLYNQADWLEDQAKCYQEREEQTDYEREEIQKYMVQAVEYRALAEKLAGGCCK